VHHKFYIASKHKISEKYEYTPGFDGGLIIVVARSTVDGIIVGGIGVCLLLHVCSVQQ
jgi:hypothetical protein